MQTNEPAYDATTAFTHLLRTLEAATPAGKKFDATTTVASVITFGQTGGPVPTPTAAAILGPSKVAEPVHAYRVEQPKGKDKK